MSSRKICASLQSASKAKFYRICINSTQVGLAIHGPEGDRLVKAHDSLRVPAPSASQDALGSRNEGHSLRPVCMDSARPVTGLDGVTIEYGTESLSACAA